MEWWQLRRRIHTSWLIALLCAGIIIGVIATQYIQLGIFGGPAWLITGITMAIIVLSRRQLYLIPIIILGGTLIGLWRGSVVQMQLGAYETLYGKSVTLTGQVSEDPDLGKSNELILRLDNIRFRDRDLSGKIWVTLNSKAEIKRADMITISGEIAPGFGSFTGVIYRAELDKVQRPQPGDIAGRLRDWFAESVRRAVDEPAASLGIGYLVGQRRALPPEIDQALQVAGLTHIVVASGYNLTILVRLARRLFARYSKYLSALVSGGLIITFIGITGLSPSMSRAGLVTGLSLLAWYYGRKFHPLVLLPFAAAITLLFNPSYGWNDLGWQLSFAAFAGVMILAPLLQSYFFGAKKPGTLRQILGETVAAQIVTLPIIIAGFGVFSNVALIANLLILPLVPLSMLLTFIAGIGALAFPAAAEIIGFPAEALLNYMVTVATYLSDQTWAQTEVNIGPATVFVAYGIIIGACFYMWWRTGYSLRDSNIIE